MSCVTATSIPACEDTMQHTSPLPNKRTRDEAPQFTWAV